MNSASIQHKIKKLKNRGLQKLILKLLYKKNNLSLNEFSNYNNRFYIYKVNGKHIPSESINWYTSYEYLKKHTLDISLYKYQPGKGDVVVDVGAGLGEEAIILSDLVGAEGKVYSIEANPTVFNILKQIVALNNLKNVTALNIAVNREDAPVKIVDVDDTYMTGFVGNDHNAHTTDVEGLRFDSFMDKYGLQKIDLLKCNIEGAERFLVDSIKKEYLPKIRNVAIACHDFRYSEDQNEFFVTKEYVKSFLKQNGFEVETQNTGIDYKDDWVYGKNLNADKAGEL
jgi:FkbM family methyltransferase